MSRALYPVQQVQVVRLNTGSEQGFTEICQRGRGIVHSPEQYRLIQQPDPMPGQLLTGTRDFVIDFAGVVDMQHHDFLQRNGVQPLQEFVIDPFGQDDGLAGVDAQPSQVRNPGKA